MNTDDFLYLITEVEKLISGAIFAGFLWHVFLMGGLALFKVKNPHTQGLDKAALDLVVFSGRLYAVFLLMQAGVHFPNSRTIPSGFLQPAVWIGASQLLRIRLFLHPVLRLIPALVLWFPLEHYIIVVIDQNREYIHGMKEPQLFLFMRLMRSLFSWIFFSFIILFIHVARWNGSVLKKDE